MIHKTTIVLMTLLCFAGCSQRQPEPAPVLEPEQTQSATHSSDLEAQLAQERAALKTQTGIMPSIAEREKREAAKKQGESSLYASGNQLSFAPPSSQASPGAPDSLFSPENKRRFDGGALQITSPKQGSHFRFSTRVSISARAQNPRDIRSVIFYANDKIIGRASGHPYRCKWLVRQRGQITLRIVATTMRNTTLTDSLMVFVDKKDLYMNSAQAP